MKKKLAALLALAAFVGVSAIAIGCDDTKEPEKKPKPPAHTHHLVWDNSDEDEHWQYCDVVGCNFVGGKTDHVDNIDNESKELGEDGICDVCGYEYPNESGHSHTLVWNSTDEDEHWQYCSDPTCDYVGDRTGHDDAINNTTKEPGKDGLCDDCGRSLVEVSEHSHTLVWYGADDDEHWQYCTVTGCDYVVGRTGHNDAINNTTKEPGKDGLCDDCGHVSKYTVSFDGNGYTVTLPASQTVAHGGTATKPQDLEPVDGRKFLGWVGADKETAFDFTAPITADTVIYAKWSDLEGTIGNPSALTLGTPRLFPMQKDGIVYYSFTAEQAGRYTISLANGTYSRMCRFTTSLAEDDGVWYGDGCDNAAKYVDIYFGTEVIITLTCLNELDAEDAKASVLVNVTTDEPLPDEKFLDGIYLDSAGYHRLVIDRERKIVSYNGNEYAFSYIGGSFERLSFVSHITGTNTYFVVKPSGNDAYRIGWASSLTTAEGYVDYESSQYSARLELFVPEEPIDISKFAGTYKPATASDRLTMYGSYISAVVIDTNGDGYYDEDSASSSHRNYYLGAACFDQDTNRLTYNMLAITVNLDDDDNAVSINITCNGTTKTYVRQGDAPAEVLSALPLEDADFNGETHAIKKQGSALYWGSTSDHVDMDVDGYDGSEFYSISVYKSGSRTVYKLKISEDGSTIELYDAAGNKLDTLQKASLSLSPLVTSEEVQTVNTSDFVDKYYFYEVQEDGWYEFSTTEFSLGIFIDADMNNIENIAFNSVNASGKTVNLHKNSVVALYIGWYYGSTPQTVSFKVVEATAPKGVSEDDPVIVEGREAVLHMNNIDQYYFKFTAPAAGDYVISFSFYDENTWKDSNYVHFVIDGVEYGPAYEYNPKWGWNEYVWKGGLTEGDPYLRRSFTDGEEIVIVADRNGSFAENAEVTLSIAIDLAASATQLDITANRLEAGVYIYDGTFGDIEIIGIQLTSDSEFTVTVGGEEQSVTSIVITREQLKLGFMLVGGPVDMALAYKMGTARHPLPVSIDDVDEDNLISVQTATDMFGLQNSYVTITAGDKDLVLSIPDLIEESWNGAITTKFYFIVKDQTNQYNNTDYYGYWGSYDMNSGKYNYALSGNGDTLTIAAGESVTIKLGATDYDFIGDHIDIMLVEAGA